MNWIDMLVYRLFWWRWNNILYYRKDVLDLFAKIWKMFLDAHATSFDTKPLHGDVIKVFIDNKTYICKYFDDDVIVDTSEPLLEFKVTDEMKWRPLL